MKRHDKYYIYMLKCVDERYYVGYTHNLEERIKLHNKGNGAKYLKTRLPVQLVYSKEYKYYKNARHAEINLKKATRKQKEELIKIYERNQSETCGCPH